MVFSPRPRRRRTRHGGRDGVAIAAAALVHPWSAATFAAAAASGTVSEDLAVTIPPELEAQILRYHHVEKWPVGTIAKQLRVHHTTVSRVLLQAGLPRILQHPKRSKADPFLPFIRATPGLRRGRLWSASRR
jgi:DNA-directed RNA polymerase specialized sigma24 family protein